VGWRDRDYAQLRPDELAELYGVQQAAPAQRTLSTRAAVWSLTTIVCVVFFALALTHRESAAPPAPPPAAAIYGNPLPSTSAFGRDAVCTEYELVTRGAWRCDSALVNSSHAGVYPARAYAGPCAHLKVVERSWVCLGNTPAPEPAPALPSVNS
jgi:hypothetical protein